MELCSSTSKICTVRQTSEPGRLLDQKNSMPIATRLNHSDQSEMHQQTEVILFTPRQNVRSTCKENNSSSLSDDIISMPVLIHVG